MKVRLSIFSIDGTWVAREQLGIHESLKNFSMEANYKCEKLWNRYAGKEI